MKTRFSTEFAKCKCFSVSTQVKHSSRIRVEELFSHGKLFVNMGNLELSS